MKIILSSFAIALTAGIAWAQTPRPTGNQFQVNTYTTSFQRTVDIATIPGQGYVVVWSSNGSLGDDTDSWSLQGQRFDTRSSPIGSQFQVNTWTTLSQYFPSVLHHRDGGFVVVWDSAESPRGRAFDSNGNPKGEDFQIAEYTVPNPGFNPHLAQMESGNFVAAWRDTNPTRRINARLFDPDMNVISPIFQVDSSTANEFFSAPEVISTQDGGFMVVWDQHYTKSIHGQKFDSLGIKTGTDFLISTYSTAYQDDPSIAMNDSGDFLVVWHSQGSFGSDTSNASVQARMLSSAGTPLANQFQVNTLTTLGQRNPSVVADESDSFWVVWQSPLLIVGSFRSNILGQRISSTREFLGEEFRVTFQRAEHYAPAVDFNGDRRMIVVWESSHSLETDTSEASVQAQQLLMPIFGDGFEAGNTDAWSSASLDELQGRGSDP